MRRFALCLILFALVFAICTVSTVSVKKSAVELDDRLSMAMDALLRGDLYAAGTETAACESCWENSSLPFFVYLDHNTFNELEYLIESISIFVPTNPRLAAEQVQRCRAILRNIIDQQKVNAENVL